MKKASTMLMLVFFPAFGMFFTKKDNLASSASLISKGADDDAIDSTFIADFHEYFTERLMTEGCPGAAIAVVKGDQVVLLEGFGDRKSGRPGKVNANSVFRIGSLSKGFAGLLTAQLVEQGYFDWDDRVQDIIPEFQLGNRAQASRITIRHLLSHSTGIQRHAYTDMTEAGRDVLQILPEFAKLQVYGKEGEYFAYQNTAFSLIEKIIKRKTGKSYEQCLKEQILDPSGMQTSSTSFVEIAQSENVAFPHTWYKSGRLVASRLNKKYYNAVSAGGINASIDDMSSWLRVLVGAQPKIASKSALDTIFSPVVRNPSNRIFNCWRGGVKANYYGLGWRVVDWMDQEIVYHGGSVNGYRSEIAIDRKNNVGICVLFNSNARYIKDVVPQFFKKYNEYLESRKSTPEEEEPSFVLPDLAKLSPVGSVRS